MTELSRGANTSLTSVCVEVAVSGARQGSVDLLVFQLGEDRKVRSDADFVFFNQPVSPEGAVRLRAADRVRVDLAGIPETVSVLAVGVALDDAVPGSLAAIAGLAVTVTGTADSHTAPALGLTSERAAVLVELYRRGGEWKLRNVSAGWTTGLSALVTEHGVTIEAPAVPAAEALPSPVLPASSPVPSSPVPSSLVPSSLVPSSLVQSSPSPNSPMPGEYQSGGRVQPGGYSQDGYSHPGGYPPPGGPMAQPPGAIPAYGPGGFPLPGGTLPGSQLADPFHPGGFVPPGGR